MGDCIPPPTTLGLAQTCIPPPTTLGLAQTCQKFCSRAPTGRPSTTLRTFVTERAEGDRFTENTSFTGFIRPFSESTLGCTPFFCGGPFKNTEGAGVGTFM